MSAAQDPWTEADPAALRLSLITRGDPSTLTGGHLYHRRLAELAPASGARLRFVRIPAGRTLLHTRVAGEVLADAVRDAPHAVLLDSLAAASMAPALGRRRSSVPLVGLLHQPPGGIEGGEPRRRVRARLDGLAWSRAALLVATGGGLADDLVRLGFPADRVRVVAPGRDLPPPPADAPSREALRSGTGAALLAVANWLPHKGIVELLDAFAALPSSAAHLHLVGDTDRDIRYRRLVDRRLNDPRSVGRVSVHGSLPPDRVAGLYAGADVFVLPSRVESYGIVYAEAMSAGLPVVGWNAGNLPRLVRDGLEGLLASPGDVRGLARALTRLSTDVALRRRLGEAALRRAASLPTWRETADGVIAVVREAIERTSREGDP